MSIYGSGSKIQIFEHQADAVLAQAAADQDTWYTILDTTYNARLYSVAIMMATANEDLEVRVIIDGNTLTGAQAGAVAGTWYWAYLDLANTDALAILTEWGTVCYRGEALEGRSVQVQLRKTTANGANVLNGRVKYAVIP